MKAHPRERLPMSAAFVQSICCIDVGTGTQEANRPTPCLLQSSVLTSSGVLTIPVVLRLCPQQTSNSGLVASKLAMVGVGHRSPFC